MSLPLHEDKNVGFYKETDFKNIEHFRVITIAKKVNSLFILVKNASFCRHLFT